MAVQGYCKDLHYNIPDYSIHLLMDRIQQDLFDFIDEIKENWILAKGNKPLDSSQYYAETVRLLPSAKQLDLLKALLIDALEKVEEAKGETIGDGDLLGRIGSNLQNSLGILNILENK